MIDINHHSIVCGTLTRRRGARQILAVTENTPPPSSIERIIESCRAGRGPALWALGIVVGLLAAYATLGLRLGIGLVEQLAFGVTEERLATAAHSLPALQLIIIPVITGCVVAILLWIGKQFKLITEIRGLAVADLLEARAVKGGKMDVIPGLYSALLSAVSLGGGASAGREGPAVHLGGTLGSAIARWAGLPAQGSRILLACGAAAAVSASFNAPVAGALFAFEVILGHYALRSIAPVAVSSVVGALIVRHHLGHSAVFSLPDIAPASFWDFPAAAVLGVAAAGLAILFNRSTLHLPIAVARHADRWKIPLWILPIPGGVLIGLIALIAPEILGVGYEATSNALAGAYAFHQLILFIVLKIIATAITLAFRFAGGVFSPSIYLGAMVGAAFGIAATGILGDQTAGSSFFAIIGMGAVAGAVLGAPLSTTLIVFELTSSYEASVAVLVSVSLATVLTQTALGGSLFQLQVRNRGYDLSGGASRLILQTVRVREFMMPLDEGEEAEISGETNLYEDDTLGRTLGFLEAEGVDAAPVRSRIGDQPVIAWVNKADAHAAYAAALAAVNEEEHG
jgi:CIC family chloride channel protein